ncbi:UvrD-helicase domain-containing protein [Cryobacterium tagatosivorans]|uniref:DNA 3'-5' helicase n=1 Tax=Cryobacterium tagatosivorans TaxID=1259199 RepID=A0A4V3I6V4_9MICO|nr:ATP-dependent helicase [Cryobacterium tagatosivorans]TFB56382.1 ATP-dependent helicase [Cryobacterium tagatosivorans]
MTSNKPVGAQIAAVESAAEHLLVLAPPGCGKTEVLAMRADRLIRSGVVRPGRHLLAITFTNRARDNLRNRLVQQLGTSRLRDTVIVMNFHELSARIVEAHHLTIGLKPDFTFPRPAWLRRTLNKITNHRGTQSAAKDLLGALHRLPLTDLELLQQLTDADNPTALQVERHRVEEHYIDYGDLQRYAQLILRNPRVAALFQAHFDAVIVDEFQDLSLQQYEISRLICTRNSTYVGDPYQGIFGWAGAQPVEVHADLQTRAGEAVDLDVSFRSSPAVLNVVNSISVSLGSAALSAAEPHNWGEGGGHAYAAGYSTDASEANGVVALTDYLAQQYPGDTIGVICRAAYRRGALERAYDRAECRPQFWDIALDTPRVGRLLKLHARQVDATLPLREQAEDLRRRASDSLQPTDIETIGEVNDACEQLLEYDFEGATVKILMDRIRDSQSIASISAGVHVLNAHVGKGQQFDWVVVVGLEEGHVPSSYSTTDDQLREDQRILLVMLSRARKGLFLTWAAGNTNQYGRTFRNGQSRWWDTMAAATKPMTPDVASIMKIT